MRPADGPAAEIDIAYRRAVSKLSDLFAHVIRPEFLYRHKWRVGDLLIWDNCAVQHKATFDYAPPLRRLMQRCTIEGENPV